MRFTTIPVFLTAAGLAVAQSTTVPVTGIQGNASVVENNPPGDIYIATLPGSEFFNPANPSGNIQGSVSATANPNGIGVLFLVNFDNLPTSGGPFLYHIHDAPVPSDGNCTGTLAHLDPYIRGETPACNSSLPQTCQVGDLSGKHGSIEASPFIASYRDDFASTTPGIGAFFGNRSITIHFANKTRITCANFTLVGSTVGGTNSSGTATSTGGASSTSTPLQVTSIGAGGKTTVSLVSLALVGLTFFL